MEMNLPRHMPALDGLRGVAVLMVVLTHASAGWQAALSPWQDTAGWPATFALPWWLALISDSGAHGVQLFFVVSAFTLTIQAGRRHDGWPAYALRRIARVGPGYWLAGAVYTMMAGLAPRLWAPHGVSLLDLGVAALFGSAWQGGASLAVVPGGWSVSCEMAFYAALPALLWLIGGRPRRAALLTVAAALAVQFVTWQLMRHDGWNFPQYVNPGSQAPVFLAGITAAFLAQQVLLSRLPGVALGLLAAAVLGLPFLDTALSHLPFAALAACAVALAARHPPALLASRLMRRLGEVSYSIYLVHFAMLAPCLAIAERLLPGDGCATLALHFGLVAGCSFVLACVTHRWVEQPGIRWAAGLLRPRQAAGVAA